MILDAIREVSRHRDLLYIITWRDIKLKYKQSIMGMLWAVLMPLLIVSAGVLVRYAFATVSGSQLSLRDMTAVTVKAVPWAFFVSALRWGTNSLVGNTNLLTKIYLPRLIFPLAAVGSQLFDFAVAAAVTTLLLIIAQVGMSLQLLWVPILVLVMVLLASAMAILFSAASLFLRDVKYIVEVLLTFAIFFTPVFYEPSVLGRWAPLLLLNPISPLLEGLNAVVVAHQSPSIPWLLYSIAVTGVLALASLVVFRKLEPYFAESV